MFNLGTLLQVSALTMGVASATPISNAKENHVLTTKNQNIVNNYNETLQQVNTSSQTWTGYDLNEWTYQYTETETKTNYQYNSNYINVKATKYDSTFTYTVNNNNCIGYGNFVHLSNQENKNYYQNITRSTIVLQLTPYNYNIDTEGQIQIYNAISFYLDEYNIEINANGRYLYKTVYTTTESSFSQYIDKQIVRYQSNVLINDIEDINNNFYYNKNSTVTEIEENHGLNNPYNDITTLNLTPKMTNYIVIDIVIGVNAYAYDQFNEEYETLDQNVIPIKTTTYGYGNITISGTNIIPDDTYEVIDLPGLMWEILTMPFAFISQAFNLTLFPGTPYQVNISNLFLSIIAVITFVWLITFFLKLKG